VHHVERRAVLPVGAVGVVERPGGLGHQVDRQGRRQARAVVAQAGQQGAQVLAGQVVHRHEVAGPLAPQIQDRHDARVVELGADARLVEEHRDEGRIVGQRGEQPLHRVAPPRLAAHLGEPDLGHPADGEPLEEQVPPVWDGVPH